MNIKPVPNTKNEQGCLFNIRYQSTWLNWVYIGNIHKWYIQTRILYRITAQCFPKVSCMMIISRWNMSHAEHWLQSSFMLSINKLVLVYTFSDYSVVSKYSQVQTIPSDHSESSCLLHHFVFLFSFLCNSYLTVADFSCK